MGLKRKALRWRSGDSSSYPLFWHFYHCSYYSFQHRDFISGSKAISRITFNTTSTKLSPSSKDFLHEFNAKNSTIECAVFVISSGQRYLQPRSCSKLKKLRRLPRSLFSLFVKADDIPQQYDVVHGVFGVHKASRITLNVLKRVRENADVVIE